MLLRRSIESVQWPEMSIRTTWGQVGTIVMGLAPDVYEVEFCDSDGRTYALAPVKVGDLLRLHHEPNHQAA